MIPTWSILLSRQFGPCCCSFLTPATERAVVTVKAHDCPQHAPPPRPCCVTNPWLNGRSVAADPVRLQLLLRLHLNLRLHPELQTYCFVDFWKLENRKLCSHVCKSLLRCSSMSAGLPWLANLGVASGGSTCAAWNSRCCRHLRRYWRWAHDGGCGRRSQTSHWIEVARDHRTARIIKKDKNTITQSSFRIWNTHH